MPLNKDPAWLFQNGVFPTNQLDLLLKPIYTILKQSVDLTMLGQKKEIHIPKTDRLSFTMTWPCTFFITAISLKKREYGQGLLNPDYMIVRGNKSLARISSPLYFFRH